VFPLCIDVAGRLLLRCYCYLVYATLLHRYNIIVRIAFVDVIVSVVIVNWYTLMMMLHCCYARHTRYCWVLHFNCDCSLGVGDGGAHTHIVHICCGGDYVRNCLLHCLLLGKLIIYVIYRWWWWQLLYIAVVAGTLFPVTLICRAHPLPSQLFRWSCTVANCLVMMIFVHWRWWWYTSYHILIYAGDIFIDCCWWWYC